MYFFYCYTFTKTFICIIYSKAEYYEGTSMIHNNQILDEPRVISISIF